MATIKLRIEALSGLTVYFVVWKSSNDHVFDFDDEIFKAIAGAETPFLTGDEHSDLGGNGRSHYTADLDLSLFPDLVDAIVQPYQQLGDDPDPLTDSTLEDALPLTLRFGRSNAVVSMEFACAIRRELNRVDFSATVTVDGQPVVASGVGVLTVRGVQSVPGDLDANWYPDLTTGVDTNCQITAAGRVEFARSNPGFTVDRAYTARLTLTVDGESVVIEKPFSVYG